MVLTNAQLDILKQLMKNSALKGNLANAGIELTYLSDYEEEFSTIFEEVMTHLLK